MIDPSVQVRPTTFAPSPWQRDVAPILTLVFLSPVLAELLMGVVHVTIRRLLVGLAYVGSEFLSSVPTMIPIGIGLLWAGLAFLFVRYVSAGEGWRDSHRLALIVGARVASMLGGVLVILTSSPIDQIGKLSVDLMAVVLFAILARHLSNRTEHPHGQSEG